MRPISYVHYYMTIKAAHSTIEMILLFLIHLRTLARIVYLPISTQENDTWGLIISVESTNNCILQPST